MPAGTYLVVDADDAAATVRDVDTGQTLALDDHPDLATHEVIEATLEPVPPLEVAYRVAAVTARRTIEVGHSEEPPTRRSQTLAADQAVGDVTRTERAGEGEVHVLSVPAENTEAAVEDVLQDVETLARAARLGVDRVETRSTEGVVSVRYLP